MLGRWAHAGATSAIGEVHVRDAPEHREVPIR